MFFDTVEELHSKFKIFDQINTIVFGIWKDKSALEYRDGALQDLRILYINYINEMRQQCNELELLNREVARAFDDVQSDLGKLETICNNPSIVGCFSASAYGSLDKDGTMAGVEEFVASSDEVGDIESAARVHCHRLFEIEKVSMGNHL